MISPVRGRPPRPPGTSSCVERRPRLRERGRHASRRPRSLSWLDPETGQLLTPARVRTSRNASPAARPRRGHPCCCAGATRATPAGLSCRARSSSAPSTTGTQGPRDRGRLDGRRARRRELAGKPVREVGDARTGSPARASSPTTPAARPDVPSGWTRLQWNFLDTVAGVNALDAWDNLIAAGAPGRTRASSSPCRHGRRLPQPRALPPLARPHAPHRDAATTSSTTTSFAARPQRPRHARRLDDRRGRRQRRRADRPRLRRDAHADPRARPPRRGRRASRSPSGIRYAARRGADIINLSFEFSAYVKARGIPDILSALRFARRQGRARRRRVAATPPAARSPTPRAPTDVLSVGAITEHGCQADYSNRGSGLDIAAPGGGQDADHRRRPELPARRRRPAATSSS